MAGGVLGDCSAGKAAKLFSLSGLFPVYKPKGPTSADVLNRLKERLLAEAGMKQHGMKRKKQVLKIGHGGTLDSAASGVLVVGIGKGTKMLSRMLTGSKHFKNETILDLAEQIEDMGSDWGFRGTQPLESWERVTDTLDAMGKITEEKPYGHITKADLEGILQKFTGNILQVPPLYSALKKGGQRLSSLVMKGKVVDAKPARPVKVYGLWITAFQPPLFTLDVECGGGFYVRSLVSDIGRELSSCAYVKELTRTKQGPFTLKDHALREECWTIDGVSQALEDSMQLLPVEPEDGAPKDHEANQDVASSDEE